MRRIHWRVLMACMPINIKSKGDIIYTHSQKYLYIKWQMNFECELHKSHQTHSRQYLLWRIAMWNDCQETNATRILSKNCSMCAMNTLSIHFTLVLCNCFLCITLDALQIKMSAPNISLGCELKVVKNVWGDTIYGPKCVKSNWCYLNGSAMEIDDWTCFLIWEAHCSQPPTSLTTSINLNHVQDSVALWHETQIT